MLEYLYKHCTFRKERVMQWLVKDEVREKAELESSDGDGALTRSTSS